MSEIHCNYSHHGFHADPESGVCYRTLNFMGFPGYRVGDDGSVWSRLVRTKLKGVIGGTKVGVGTQWNQLTPGLSDRNYARVTLHPHKRRIFVHHLVLLAFVSSMPHNAECRHIDGDPKNNTVSNIRWGTHTENIEDRHRHGRHWAPKGEKNGLSKLSDSNVLAILRLKGKLSLKKTASMFGVSHNAIACIQKGITWKHVTGL